MATRFLQKTNAPSVRPDSTINEAFRRYRCGAAMHAADSMIGIPANQSLQQSWRCLAEFAICSEGARLWIERMRGERRTAGQQC